MNNPVDTELTQAKEYAAHLEQQLNAMDEGDKSLEDAIHKIDSMIDVVVEVGNRSNAVIQALERQKKKPNDEELTMEVNKAFTAWMLSMGQLLSGEIKEREMAMDNLKSQAEHAKTARKQFQNELVRIRAFIREAEFGITTPKTPNISRLN